MKRAICGNCGVEFFDKTGLGRCNSCDTSRPIIGDDQFNLRVGIIDKKQQRLNQAKKDKYSRKLRIKK